MFKILQMSFLVMGFYLVMIWEQTFYDFSSFKPVTAG